MTYTYTYAILDVSQEVYDEIADRLRAAGYRDCFHDKHDGRTVINMHGIAIRAEEFEGPVQPPPPPFTIPKVPLTITNDQRIPLNLTGLIEIICLVCNEPVEIVDAMRGRVLPHIHDGKYASIQINNADGTFSSLNITLVHRP